MTGVTFEITELHSATVGKIVFEVEVEVKELRLLFLYGFETAVIYIGRDDIGFVMEQGREGAELTMEEVEEEVEVEGARMTTSLSSSPMVISIESRGGVTAELDVDKEIKDGGVDTLFLESENEPANIEWTG